MYSFDLNSSFKDNKRVVFVWRSIFCLLKWLKNVDYYVNKILSMLDGVIAVSRKKKLCQQIAIIHSLQTAGLLCSNSKSCKFHACLLFNFYKISLRSHRYLIIICLHRQTLIESSSSHLINILHEIGSTPNNSSYNVWDMQIY